MALVYDPDPKELKRKMDAKFDFRSVTRELLRDSDATAANDNSKPGAYDSELSYRDARKIVRHMEKLAWGRALRTKRKLFGSDIVPCGDDPIALQRLAGQAAAHARKLYERRARKIDICEYQLLSAELYAEARKLLGVE